MLYVYTITYFVPGQVIKWNGIQTNIYIYIDIKSMNYYNNLTLSVG